MKRNALKSIVCLALIAVLGSWIVPTHAQATQPACDMDLSQATAMLSQAQAKASSGDTAGALALLDQITQAIKDIKTKCAGSSVDLSQTFTEPTGAYSINYPAGWSANTLPGDPNAKAKTNIVVFVSDAATLDAVKSNKTIQGQGIIAYVGTGEDVIRQIGSYKSGQKYDQMTALSLLQAAIAGQSPSGGPKFGTAQKADPIGSYETASATYTLTTSSSSPASSKGQLIIMQLGDNQFALFLTLNNPDKDDTAAPIALSMAATLKVPAAK